MLRARAAWTGTVFDGGEALCVTQVGPLSPSDPPRVVDSRRTTVGLGRASVGLCGRLHTRCAARTLALRPGCCPPGPLAACPARPGRYSDPRAPPPCARPPLGGFWLFRWRQPVPAECALQCTTDHCALPADARDEPGRVPRMPWCTDVLWLRVLLPGLPQCHWGSADVAGGAHG